jgi:hypothetical protein
MIVRGDSNDVQINRGGQLSPEQAARIARLKPFRLPIVPSLLFGGLLISYGVLRQDTAGWVVVLLGLVLLGSGWTRYRAQSALKAGVVQPFVGLLERVRTSPFAMFEAELILDGKSYVLLANLGSQPLKAGTRYRSFVVRGIARMGVIVAMEEA